jgi:hypothetical protein
VTVLTAAQDAARELLRAIADRDPLAYRKATELAAAVLNIDAGGANEQGAPGGVPPKVAARPRRRKAAR